MQLTLKRSDKRASNTRDGNDLPVSSIARYSMAYNYVGPASQPFSSSGSREPTNVRVERPKYHFNPARAAVNLAEWSKYLPADCIAAMIKDGWQLTT